MLLKNSINDLNFNFFINTTIKILTYFKNRGLLICLQFEVFVYLILTRTLLCEIV
jgi:hypothetical protein